MEKIKLQNNPAKKSFSVDGLLLCALLGVFIANENNSTISSFFPEVAERHVGVPEEVVGVVFAIYSAASFTCSLIIGKKL